MAGDLSYVINIRIDTESMDEGDKEEILASAEPTDNDGGLRRYLGDRLNDTEDYFNSLLPEGISAKISEVGHV